jgi:ATP-dependent Clp protease ATP-binding subunit ClpX
VKQYQRLFEMERVSLSFSDDAMDAVARKAIDRKTGARGLRSILESTLLDTMYDLPTLEGVEEIVINGEVVDGNAQPLYIYAERKEEAGKPA